MYQVTVGGNTHQVDIDADRALLDGLPFEWDIVRLTDRTFHIIRHHQSITAEVLAINAAEKTVSLTINGCLHTVVLKDRFDLLLEKMGISSAVSTKINTIKAPMPGLIVGVSVQAGDTVHKGDPILVLEAMKMENLIKAPGDALVKNIRIQPGDRVEKGQVLIEFS